MAHSNRQDDRSPKPGSNIRNTRRRRLEVINARLRKIGLQEFVGLGNYKKGECELTKVISVHEFTRTWVIIFGCIWPDGKHGEWSMLFNENPERCNIEGQSVVISGAHCIVTLNRQWFVLVKQDRRTLDGWNVRPLESLRGFNSGRVLSIGTPLNRDVRMPMRLDLSNPVTSLPVKIVGRKLAPLMSSGLVIIDEMSLMGVTWENSGSNRVFVVKSHMNLHTDDLEAVFKITGTEAMEIHYPTIDEVYDGFYDLGLAGEQCTSTLWYFDRMVRQKWNSTP